MLWIRFVDGCVDCVGLAVRLSVVWITCNLWCVLLVVSQLGVELDLCTMRVLYLYAWGLCFAIFLFYGIIWITCNLCCCFLLVVSLPGVNLIFVQCCKLHIYSVRGLHFTSKRKESNVTGLLCGWRLWGPGDVVRGAQHKRHQPLHLWRTGTTLFSLTGARCLLQPQGGQQRHLAQVSTA